MSLTYPPNPKIRVITTQCSLLFLVLQTSSSSSVFKRQYASFTPECSSTHPYSFVQEGEQKENTLEVFYFR